MESALLLSGILLSLNGLISPISAQRLPNIACPQFFEYLFYNQQFIGHIAVRHDPQYETNELVVEFSQYGAYQWSYVGSLTLMDSQEVTKSHLANGEPINYRVDFPIPSDPPKLTKITLNNQVLCSAAQYPPPKTAITLRHSLLSTTVPLAFLDSRRGPQWDLGPSIPAVKQPDYTIPQIQVPAPRTTARPRPVVQQQTNLNRRVSPTPVPIDQTLTTVCGRERAVTTPLIFQGEQLQRGQLPWLVGLFERGTDNGLIFFCGGSLISSSTVLSAAHCFRLPGRDLPADRAVVSLGRNTIDIISEGELREVSELLFHDAYEAFSANADMVLVRLAKKVIFNDYIVPICLWNENYPLQLPAGFKMYVAGWGADENGNVNTQFSKITDTNVVSESDCLRETVRSLVQPNTICAKRAGAGPCASDGGGGLMLRDNNVWLLRGVISLGLQKNNTCDLSRPSIYTDVAKHIAWLRQNMWE